MTKTKEDLQLIAFSMISYVGSAKSNYLEAIQEARLRNFNAAQTLIDEGDAMRVKGHEQHFELIQLEAEGQDLPFSLILAHAEDQLMNAEMVLTLAQESIHMYQRITDLEEKLK